MRYTSVLIKPVSGACNLRCTYCFYHDLIAAPGGAFRGKMSEETMEVLVRRAMEETSDSVTFAFQGGEPMLAGLDFFERFVAEVGKYAKGGPEVRYAIQTNGLFIDGAWAAFFKKHGFLVGLSLDGDAEAHNRFRLAIDGAGTHRLVERALAALVRHGVEYNILCVVTRHSARRAQALYRYFKGKGARYLQFIPCLDPLEAERGGEAFSLLPAHYAEFLKALFDVWERDYRAGDYVSVRLFDDWAHILAGMPPGSCATSGRCGGYLVVESDGETYPCDFYVLEEKRLGNIHDAPLAELMAGAANSRFIEESLPVPKKCRKCEYGQVCRCGCRRDRLYSPEGEVADNYFCEAYTAFFDYAYPRLMEIAARERRAAVYGR